MWPDAKESGARTHQIATRIDVRLAQDQVMGIVSVRGRFDEDAVRRYLSAVAVVLNHDVGELYIDLREVAEMGPTAIPALVHVRRRAARLQVTTRLVLVAGPALEAIKGSGVGRGFQACSALPDGLVLPDDGDGHNDGDGLPPIARITGHRRAAPSHGDATVPILEADDQLAVGVAPHLLDEARRQLRARVVPFGRGALRLPDGAAGADLGLLLLEGAMVRRVGQAAGFSAEILGPGNVLRLGTHPGEDTSPWFVTDVRGLQSGSVAVLDRSFAELAARYGVLPALIDRAMARAHHVSVSLAAAHYPRVERRVLVVLWHLAQRFGRVTGEGVVLTLQLTHALLADLTASRRPSVTLALQNLEQRGAIERRDAGLLLRGSPEQVAEGGLMSDAPSRLGL